MKKIVIILIILTCYGLYSCNSNNTKKGNLSVLVLDKPDLDTILDSLSLGELKKENESFDILFILDVDRVTDSIKLTLTWEVQQFDTETIDLMLKNVYGVYIHNEATVLVRGNSADSIFHKTSKKTSIYSLEKENAVGLEYAPIIYDPTIYYFHIENGRIVFDYMGWS